MWSEKKKIVKVCPKKAERLEHAFHFESTQKSNFLGYTQGRHELLCAINAHDELRTTHSQVLRFTPDTLYMIK